MTDLPEQVRDDLDALIMASEERITMLTSGVPDTMVLVFEEKRDELEAKL